MLSAFTLLLSLAQAPVQVPVAQRHPMIDHLWCAPVPGTGGYCDEYWITGPPTIVLGQKYPLVVMFHGYGEHANHAWLPGAAAFMDAAKAWGPPSLPYFVVFHEGGKTDIGGTLTSITYGCEEFHRATEAVLEDVTSKWPIDKNRIYGYGLSMGGGECLAFAARHQDPTSSTMLAALVNQSGTISMTRIYAEDPTWQPLLQDLYVAPPYGSSPQADFLYQRATTLDLPFDGTFTAPLDIIQEWGNHQAHNLRWVSRANFIAPTQDDPETMIEPIQTFQHFLAHAQVTAPDFVGLLPGADLHQWNAITPATILAYFDARDRAQSVEQFSTQLPTLAGYHNELLLFAEDDVRHHCFSVQRTNPSLFGRLHVRLYPAFPALNALVLSVNQDPAVVNVSHVTIHADQHLHHVDWSGTPGTTVHLYALGVNLGPIDVVGPGSPTLVQYKVGGVLLDAVGQWTWSSDTLSLPEDGATGLQRDWFVHY